MDFEFEWDEEKAASNLKKHGVSFPYAMRVFSDELRIDRVDDDAAYDEIRWLTVGLVQGRELTVVYTVRGVKIRIISAREAVSHEREEYWENR